MQILIKSQYLREKKIQVFACFIGPQESAKVNSVFTEWKKTLNYLSLDPPYFDHKSRARNHTHKRERKAGQSAVERTTVQQ